MYLNRFKILKPKATKIKQNIKGPVIIDFKNMNQYQYCKYLERLKHFERKEAIFHTTLKENIMKLYDAVAIEKVEKKIHKNQDLLYYSKRYEFGLLK